MPGWRDVVSQQPRSRWAVALGGLVVLASAPFGGLSPVPTDPGAALVADVPVTTGPFRLTVHKVVSLPDLEPAARPDEEGNRLLVVSARVENVEGAPRDLYLLTQALDADGAGVVDTVNSGEASSDPDIFVTEDATRLRVLNPGLAHEVAIVFQQEPDRDGSVTLSLTGYDYVDVDPLTLADDEWLIHDTADVRGDFAVEVRE